MDAALPAAEWPLDALAAKMQQYCPMLTDLSADLLAAEARGDFEALRGYLRRRGAEAYQQKARTSAYCKGFSIQPAPHTCVRLIAGITGAALPVRVQEGRCNVEPADSALAHTATGPG